MNTSENRRVLFVDDMPSIHEDFRKILCPQVANIDLDADEVLLFGAQKNADSPRFEMDSAFQGAEALDKVQASLQSGAPYAMAFVDMRMPPGWDGVETVERLWQADPRLQVVFCTAFSDYVLDGSIESTRRARSAPHSKKALRSHRGVPVRQCADHEVANDRASGLQNEHA